MGGDRNWREKIFVGGDWLTRVTGMTVVGLPYMAMSG